MAMEPVRRCEIALRRPVRVESNYDHLRGTLLKSHYISVVKKWIMKQEEKDYVDIEYYT
jgi:hypothetical protein